MLRGAVFVGLVCLLDGVDQTLIALGLGISDRGGGWEMPAGLADLPFRTTSPGGGACAPFVELQPF